MSESRELLAAREHLARGEASYRSAAGLAELEQGKGKRLDSVQLTHVLAALLGTSHVAAELAGADRNAHLRCPDP